MTVSRYTQAERDEILRVSRELSAVEEPHLDERRFLSVPTQRRNSS